MRSISSGCAALRPRMRRSPNPNRDDPLDGHSGNPETSTSIVKRAHRLPLIGVTHPIPPRNASHTDAARQNHETHGLNLDQARELLREELVPPSEDETTVDRDTK